MELHGGVLKEIHARPLHSAVKGRKLGYGRAVSGKCRMKCPIDNTDLVMTERQGIEIDYCPKCRGVWLDRGELDKIIERAAPASPQQYRAAEAPHYRDQPYDERRHRKRKSLLGELFDF